MTDQEKTEIKMFGMTQEEVKKQINPMNLPYSPSMAELMHAMSVLSDAQHMIEFGSTAPARQFINKAKFCISEVMHRIDTDPNNTSTLG